MKKSLLSFFAAAGITAIVFSATGNYKNFKPVFKPVTDTTPVMQGHQADTANNGYIGTPAGTKTSGLGSSTLGLGDTTGTESKSSMHKRNMKSKSNKNSSMDSTSSRPPQR